MHWSFFVVIVLGGLPESWGQISASSDLNCDFERSCRWSNGTNGVEDGADWAIGRAVDVDQYHQIAQAMNGPAGLFAYTILAGGPQAFLVSDVVQCQLGGSQLRYWYFRMEEQSTLDVCIRQPPGPGGKLDCYAGIANTMARQWIYRSIELPPVSQTFEIVFRATFTTPSGTVALDEIVYDAILCDVLLPPSSSSSHYRMRRATPAIPLIGYHDWQLLKMSNVSEKRPMLVVAQPVGEEEDGRWGLDTTAVLLPSTDAVTSSVTAISSTSSNSANATIAASSSTAISTTTTIATTTTAMTSSSSTTSNVMTVDSGISNGTTIVPDHVANFMSFMKQVSPILPFVPGFVRTLQATDPVVARATGRTALEELAGMAGIDISGVGNVVPGMPIPPPSGLLPFREGGDGTAPIPATEFLTGNSDMTQLAKQFGFAGRPFGGATSPPLSGESTSFLGFARPSATSFSMGNAQPPGNSYAFGQYATTDLPAFVTEASIVTVYPPRVASLIDEGDRGETMREHQKRLDSETRIRPASRVEFERRKMLQQRQKAGMEDEGGENLDLSLLNEDEIRHLEDIHRKIFAERRNSPEARKMNGKLKMVKSARSSTAAPLVVFDKGGTGTPLIASSSANIGDVSGHAGYTEIRKAIEIGQKGGTFSNQLAMLSKHLPANAMGDLARLREIPDLDTLTKGMDLTLLNRPGGFAILKQQFIERMIRRNLGLNPEGGGVTTRRPLPPPIVPVKVSASGMKEMNFDE